MTDICTLTPEVFRLGCEVLSESDPIMRSLILRYGDRTFPEPVGVWTALVRSVVAQQISTVTAARIHCRLEAHFGDLSMAWQSINERSFGELREMGLNAQKAKCLIEVASGYQKGEFSEAFFASADEAVIIEKLTQLKGVGHWTAKNVLIFGLARADIFPLEDYGVRMALAKHYFPDETARTLARQSAKSCVKSIECLWKSYRTIATWFLWCSLENSTQEK